MPCVAHGDRRWVAPRALIASAALARVPPVEIMSSTMTAILPLTSPTMSVTSETSGSGRRLKTIASELCRRLAKFSARVHAAGVGRDDDDLVLVQPLALEVVAERRRRLEIVDREIEEALDLRGVEVERHEALGAGRP